VGSLFVIKVADELGQQGGELLRCLVVRSMTDALDHLNLAAPQRRNVQLRK
jgi:hypothetical protein